MPDMLAALHLPDRTAPVPTPSPVSKPTLLSSINERDIDLMFLIAMHGSPAFRAALVNRLTGMPIAEFIGARREVHTENDDDTDLILEVRTEGGERLAIIIQVKIDPSFSRKQSERCRSLGKMGRAQGHWDRFLTCLCAPKHLASLCMGVGGWDHVLFLEDAAEELAIHDEPFAEFLGGAIRQTAAEYGLDGHVAQLKANAFWMRYADFCLQEFPDLRMARVRSVSSSNEPRPKFLVNTLPTGVRLEHKASNGHVDLTLKNRDARALAENLGDALPHDLSVRSARRSAVVQADVPRLVATEPFDSQAEAVRDCLGAVRRLAEFWPIVGRRMGYDPKLNLLQEPLGHALKLAANLLPSRRFFRG